jgi:hypothetical protein
MFHYDDCQEKVTRPVSIPTDPTQTSALIIPSCKCCGDQGELVCARPGTWDDAISLAIGRGENEETGYSIPLRTWDTKRNILDAFVNDSDPNVSESPYKCCKENGYYVKYDPNTKTVTIGCSNYN